MDGSGLPEIGGEETVSVADSDKGSLQGVLKGSGRAERRSVSILNTTELEKSLDSGGSDDTGTTGSGDKSDSDGTALALDLGGNGVGLTESRTPVTSSDGNDGELGNVDGGANGSSNLLSGLDTETNVAIGVTDKDNSLKSGALTGTGLLLDRLDVHNLVLEAGKELVDDLELLDGKSVVVDLLKGSDLASLDKTSKLGDGSPSLLFLLLAAAATLGATTTGTAAGTAKTATSGASLLLLRLFRHFVCVYWGGDRVELLLLKRTVEREGGKKE